MAVDGMLFTFTIYAQSVIGYSAVQFALTMMIMTVISIVGVSVVPFESSYLQSVEYNDRWAQRKLRDFSTAQPVLKVLFKKRYGTED